MTFNICVGKAVKWFNFDADLPRNLLGPVMWLSLALNAIDTSQSAACLCSSINQGTTSSSSSWKCLPQLNGLATWILSIHSARFKGSPLRDYISLSHS